jgi:predicted RNA methylase
MEEKLVTLAILTYSKAQILKNVLENEDFSDITKNKLFIHINQIPENILLQKKLKESLENSIIYDATKKNNTLNLHSYQIIFTLDAPHPFLSDFLSSSKVFFINYSS